MGIRAAELFGSPEIDFTGVSPAQIFNRAVLPKMASLESWDAPPETPQLGGGPDTPQPRRSSPEALFAGPAEPDLIPQPPAMGNPATGAATPAPSPFAGENYNAPASGKYGDFTDFMLQSEGRFDGQGKLQVYHPPGGDGGGAYEVAGITEHYQPREAAELRDMVNSGRSAEATEYVKNFYRKRAAPYTSLTASKGLQLQLADTVHHRGEGGLRRVLQRATGSDAEDYGDLIGSLEKLPQPLDAFHSARKDYEWEEVDRGRASRKKFRKGLLNRFNNADAAARSFL